MIDRMLVHVRATARNNAYANDALLSACVRLGARGFAAPRTGFFGSLRATLNHVHAVDRYFLDALEEGGQGRAALDPGPGIATPVALRMAQARLDARLIAFCDALGAADLERRVATNRGAPVFERIEAVLAHLFLHQVHHRGQAHAMLAGTEVAPPQLDEFFLDLDAASPAAPFREM